MRILVKIVAVILLGTSGAFAQAPAGSTGAEPPSRKPSAARPAAPLAVPSPTPEAATPIAPRTAEPKPAEPVKNTAVRSADDIAKKTKAITAKIDEYKSRIGLGASALGKWAGTAELFTSYAEATRGAELTCELRQTALADEKKSGSSEYLISALRKEVDECKEELKVQATRLVIFQNTLKRLTRDVDVLDNEIKKLGEMTDAAAKDRRTLDLEKQLAGKIGDTEREVYNLLPDKRPPSH